MMKITVNTARPYDIFVGSGLIDKAGELSRKVNDGQKVLVITDSNVAPLYADKTAASYRLAGYSTEILVFPAGEQSKNLNTISSFYARLAKSGFTRGDLLVALGGGVTGDMTGFAAATWLRGIDFVQIPTTLLAQVDSSVGGKTGVDIPEGKNLVGAFWQPVLVLADTNTLDTLPDNVFSDGMAEVIKTAAIKDSTLFEILENQNAKNLDNREQIISKCIDIKRGVVERDEREAGERKLLNFGHTLGHALEKYYNYSGLSHGFAVAVGMSIITEVSERHQLTEQGTALRLNSLLEKFHLPIDDPAPTEDYISGILLDKKRAGSNIDLVFLKNIGTSFVYPLPINNISEFIGMEGRK
jgi:3-dehydroquinate synthase